MKLLTFLSTLDTEPKYAVYPGSEKIDLGDKRIACLCSSQKQAEHMAEFWAPYGYWEELT